ncbi:LuxR family transcriptional regulator [Roseibium sp. MMSF_3412]|uniref:helix-turn-helix transcriptional regulator n=1 Tax=Roseibium sp. MMSF_3412 TaxID=3046712 RepID=UPI00273D2EEA|nr:LuxR family transcriptional regulator [Roseibium sp. MMSF_3412]
MGKTLFVGECYRELSNVRTNYDVFKFLKKLSDEFGFERFAVLFLPDRNSTQISSHMIVSNWPPELIRAYDDMKLVVNSPIIEQLRCSIGPLEWELEAVNKKRSHEETQNSVNLFREFDMVGGVYFPTYDATGRRGAVSFAGNRQKLDPDELATLHLLALFTYNQISEVADRLADKSDNLSPRERECVYWSSEGKTNSEIGVILSISENTVSSYMISASRKLGAVNRSQTIAIAIRAGIIS